MIKRLNWDKLGNIVIGIAIGVAISFGISDADSTAGTSSDPLVTVSYMQQQMEALETRLTAEIKESAATGSSTGSSEAAYFKVVNITSGTTLYMGASTEFILRVGSAVVVDPNAVGIPDLTDGSKVDNGVAVPIDHHMLVPSNDGRGVKITSDSWIMIKGAYSTTGN